MKRVESKKVERYDRAITEVFRSATGTPWRESSNSRQPPPTAAKAGDPRRGCVFGDNWTRLRPASSKGERVWGPETSGGRQPHPSSGRRTWSFGAAGFGMSQ